MSGAAFSSALLGDTAERDYSRKLRLFNAFAAPELCRSIAGLGLCSGMRVLDAGCGTGEALAWLAERVGPLGDVMGIDLATAHVAASRTLNVPNAEVFQADLLTAPCPPASFDLIWCVNTINHLREPLNGVRSLAALLRPGGRIALGQSSFLPDMFFAWDSRLERLTNEAVRQYYRERYGIQERELASVRSTVGTLRHAGLHEVTASTIVIERVSPLAPSDEAYLLDVIFRGTWGERLRPYLPLEDYEQLARLCDPGDARYALKRPDFHFLQTFTVAVGHR